jgi:hypothetical protein
MRYGLLLGLVLGLTARATPVPDFVDFANLLAAPMPTRVAQFKKMSATGYKFLSRTAFDSSQNLQTRWRAVTTMGHVDIAYFHKDIERALKSSDWFLRNAALIAILHDERTRAVHMSAQLVSDPALVVRTQAVHNLLQLNASESAGLLWQQIFARQNFRGHESLWVRVHMAEALAHFATPGSAKGFQRLLQDSDERLHKWAILGLENATGFKVGDRSQPLEIRRQEWLERLGVQEI